MVTLTILSATSTATSERAQSVGDELWLPVDELEAATGWEFKPDEGMCRAELCVPVYGTTAGELVRERDGSSWVNFVGFARYLGLPYAADEVGDAWYFGNTAQAQTAAFSSLVAPDFELPDLAGRTHRRSDHRGKKVLLGLWASWCGCRFDIPVWEALRLELQPLNVEVITVSCDSKGIEASRPWIEAAQPTHPSLLDPHHLVPELYNTRNVPAIFWIDEDERIVRGNDPTYLTRLNRETNERTTNERYLGAMRDWARNGASSIYVTADAETARRIGESDEANAQAMAHFRLGLYLEEQGKHASSVAQFKRALELKPENWNYKRQAFNLGDIESDFGTTREAAFNNGIPMYPTLELPDPPQAG